MDVSIRKGVSKELQSGDVVNVNPVWSLLLRHLIVLRLVGTGRSETDAVMVDLQYVVWIDKPSVGEKSTKLLPDSPVPDHVRTKGVEPVLGCAR